MSIEIVAHSFRVRLLVMAMAMACVPSRTSALQFAYPPEIQTEQHVYKRASDTDLKLWVFRSALKTETPPAAIVFFFGGGWSSGSPSQFLSQAQYLQSRGITAILADYRVASRHKVQPAQCVEDAKSAVRWIRAHSQELGINPERICAAGGSAGGHIACATALLPGFEGDGEDMSVSSAPDALALFNPVLMLASLDGAEAADIGEPKQQKQKSRFGAAPEKLSPIHHVRTQLPPTIIFHGEADSTVRIGTVIEFTKRMTAAGNRCDLKTFPTAPHGFFNLREAPQPSAEAEKSKKRAAGSDPQQYRQWHLRTLLQLDQFLASLGWISGEPTLPVVDDENIRLRGNFQHSFQRFHTEKAGHVAFLGGSITEMDGYRPRVMEWLTKRFPETKFTFTNAGIASTCSHTGAFRLNRDVLSQGSVDLLLVEFAVNDDQDARHSADDCVRGMEGIIRHVRQHNPRSDIVMIDFVNPEMLATAQAGKSQLSVEQHERVARHYQISSIDVPATLASLIASQKMSWETFGGTHPGPAGNQWVADGVAQLLTAAWSHAAIAKEPPLNYPAFPKRLLDSSFDEGDFLPASEVQIDGGWQRGIPDWTTIAGSNRDRFLGESIFYSTQPESELSFHFSGKAVGAYVLAGPDAGQLEVQIDEGESKTFELYHSYSSGLHYPRTVMFASGLTFGDHALKVRLAGTHHASSKGTAARILAFTISR